MVIEDPLTTINITTYHDKDFATLYFIKGGEVHLDNCLFSEQFLPIDMTFIRSSAKGYCLTKVCARGGVHHHGPGLMFSECALQIGSDDVITPIGEEMFFGSYTKLYFFPN